MRTATSWIFLGGGCLKSTPEEKVRQRFIETLINEYHYPANTIRREVPIQHGSKELRDKDGNPVRADIVVYASKAACLNRDQGKINFVVECKRNKVEDGYAQLVSYIFNTSANGGVWTNGDGTVFYRRENKMCADCWRCAITVFTAGAWRTRIPTLPWTWCVSFSPRSMTRR